MPLVPRVSPFVQATITNFFFFLSLNGYVLLPLHVTALGGTEVEIGIIMGLYPAVGIVLQPLLGPWVDALGRRPFMLFGVGALVVASVLAAVAPSIPWLAVTRLLQGVGFSAFFVAMFSYVIDIVPVSRRGWALGIYGVSGFAASAIAPVIAEAIVRRVGFRMLFAVSAVLALVTAAVVAPLRQVRRHGDIALPTAASWMRGGAEDLLHVHMLVTAFFGFGSGAIFTFLPTFAEELGVTTVSLFYMAYAVAAIAVRIFGGRLIDTRGRRAVIIPSMFIQTTAPAILAVAGFAITRTSATPVVPILFLAGLASGGAHGFLYPGLAALVVDWAPADRRASVVGLFSAMFLAGQAGGAMLLGYVAHALGYAAMWSVVTALLVAGSLVSLRLRSPTAA